MTDNETKVNTVAAAMQRTQRHANDPAMVPNHVELLAMQQAGLGPYPGSDAAFVRRFLGKGNKRGTTTAATATKAASDFKDVRAAHKQYRLLFIALRKPDVIFDQATIQMIEAAQASAPVFVLHEPDVNQSAAAFKTQYEQAKKQHSNVVAILDPAQDSVTQLEQKAALVAEDSPKMLLTHRRHYKKQAPGYLAIMRPFLSKATRVVDIGAWPRYSKSKNGARITSVPAPILLFGIDAVCHGVSLGGSKKPTIVFLNTSNWLFVISRAADMNALVAGSRRSTHFNAGKSTSYEFSRVDNVHVADQGLKQLKLLTQPQLLQVIAQSPSLSKLFNSI